MSTTTITAASTLRCSISPPTARMSSRAALLPPPTISSLPRRVPPPSPRLPRPRALVAVGDLGLSDQIQSRITPDILDFEIADDDGAAIELFKTQFRPVVLTDSLELIRRLRSQQAERAPFILYISELDEGG